MTAPIPISLALPGVPSPLPLANLCLRHVSTDDLEWISNLDSGWRASNVRAALQAGGDVRSFPPLPDEEDRFNAQECCEMAGAYVETRPDRRWAILFATSTWLSWWATELGESGYFVADRQLAKLVHLVLLLSPEAIDAALPFVHSLFAKRHRSLPTSFLILAALVLNSARPGTSLAVSDRQRDDLLGLVRAEARDKWGKDIDFDEMHPFESIDEYGSVCVWRSISRLLEARREVHIDANLHRLFVLI